LPIRQESSLPGATSPKQTIAYDILVGGLLVAVLGGLVWKRGPGAAAAASMAVGSLITLGTMIILEISAAAPLDGIYANEPTACLPRQSRTSRSRC